MLDVTNESEPVVAAFAFAQFRSSGRNILLEEHCRISAIFTVMEILQARHTIPRVNLPLLLILGVIRASSICLLVWTCISS